jgi:hypothetical protein
VTLSDEVECDEAYVIAGHKGQPEVVKSKGRQGRRRRLKGPCGRGTLEKERPPVFGMMQRGGPVVINLLANVKQKTIEPLIKDTIVPGTRVYTDDMAFMHACLSGDTSIRVSIMDGVSSLEMKMATAFVKSM